MSFTPYSRKNMTLRLITGDWQLESRPPCDRKTAQGTSIRFKENQDVINKMMEQAYKMGCRAMDHLGDMSEEINPDSAVMTAAATLFRNAFDMGYDEIVGVPGNHDGSLFDISSSSMAPFTALHERILFFHEPRWHGNRLYLPYLHEKTPEQLGIILANACKAMPANPVLMAHYAYTGCTIGAKNLILPGDYLGRGQIPAAFKLAFFAHIHKQQVVKDKDLTVVFAGSPVICDHGERKDPKGFVVYNDATGTYEMVQIKPARRWIEVNWPIYAPKEGRERLVGSGGVAPAEDPSDFSDQPWLPTDIVKINGIRGDDVNVKSSLQAAFKKGLVEPFYWRDTTTLATQERLVRAEDVAGAEDLRGSVVAFFDKQWPEATETREKALHMVLEALQTAKPTAYSSFVRPNRLTATNWMSWPKIDHTFRTGVPVLLQGANGKGKSNFLEALMFCMTGQTAKRLKNASLVRQGQKRADLSLELAGDKADFIISRTIKIGGKGAAVQTVKLTMRKAGETEWVSLADGGVSDTQAVLRQIIGASYESLRATRFAFQGDLSPFLGADPSDRKKVLAEIIGLDPIAVAFKGINDHKNAVVKLFSDAKASLAGMLSIFDPSAIAVAVEAQARAKKSVADAREHKAAADAILVTSVQKADICRSNVVDMERVLSTMPNVEAEVAAQEQALASAAESYEQHLGTLAGRKVAAKAKVAAIAGTAPAAGLEKANALTKGLQDTAAAHIQKIEAAVKVQTETALSHAGLDAKVEASRTALATSEDTYKKAYAVLGARWKEANTRVKEMKAQNIGDVLAADVIKATTPQIEKEAADTAAVAASVQITASVHTADLATFQAGLKATCDRIAELKKAETGNCSLCGQELNTAHIAKELAELSIIKTNQEVDCAAKALTKTDSDTWLREAQEKEKSAAKKLADHTANVAKVDRDIADRKSAEEMLAAVTKEGTDLTSTYEKTKADTETLLLDLLRQKTSSDAILLPLLDAVRVATSDGKLAATALENHLSLVKSLEQAVKDLSAAQSDLDAITQEGQDLDAGYAKKSADITAALEAKRKEAGEWESKRTDLDARLLTAREALSKVESDAASARASLESVNQVLDLADQSQKSAESHLTALRESERKVLELTGTSESLQEQAAVLTTAADALNPQNGLPVFLIDAKLAFLEDRINFYMGRLGMSNLRISLSTLDGNKETLAILVDNGMLPQLDVNAYSGGQRDRIEMAVKRALTELAETTLDVRLGLLAWDEPGGYLDEEGKSALVSIAHEAATSGEAPVALIISHDRKISSSFSAKLVLGEDEEGGSLLAA